MKNSKIIFQLLLIYFIFNRQQKVSAQERLIPAITTSQEIEKQIELYEISIFVKVIGNIANTTIEMTFYNPNNRILEGELNFPLEEHQIVSGYALEVNGKMREGVMVEKVKARNVFENTIRRKIDPGLIEKTVGNNYKTRVYPIPAKGFKRLSISIQEEMSVLKSKGFRYHLPLNYGITIKKIQLNLEIYCSKNSQPTISASPLPITLSSWQNLFQGNTKQENILLDQNLSIIIPFESTKNVFTTINDGENYFYAPLFKNIPIIKQDFSKIKQVDIYWDVSLSRKSANMNKEIDLVLKYLKKHPNKVNIHTFSAYYFDKHTFKSNQINEIKVFLEQLEYDGASDFSCLEKIKRLNTSTYFLFSDGIENFSKVKKNTIPFHVVNSSVSANYSFLKNISLNKGHFINLNLTSIDESLNLLEYEVFEFLGIKEKTNDFDLEFYPKNQVLNNSFSSISGKWNGKQRKITLLYGTSNQILSEETILLSQKNNLNNPLISKLWAEKKVDYLSINALNNKEKIIELAKKHSILTDFTSLLVLDRVEDYVENRITPPADLIKQYQEMLKVQQERTKFNEKSHIDEVLRQYNERIAWWKKDFKPKPIQKTNPSNPTPNPRGAAKQIRGKIISSDGLGIPGVTISIMDTDMGTNTDFDGNFLIQARVGDILNISSIGYVTQTISINENNEYTLTLLDDSGALSEVVVTGYSSSVEAESVVSESPPPVALEDEKIVSNKNEEAEIHIKLKEWSPNTPYLQELKANQSKDWDKIYEKFRVEYHNTPAFYLEIADFYIQNNQRKKGLRILSNLSEIALEDHIVLRILGHRLQQLKEINKSIEIFEKVLIIREEEPQSYRDLALAYKDANQPQKAVEYLYSIVEKKWDDRYTKVNDFALFELNNIISMTESNLNTDFIDQRLLKALPTQLRIVLNWSVPDCDLDLWVTDPYNEKCFYSNQLTKIGSRYSGDCTQGYGPEEVILKNSPKGIYKIETNFFGSQLQKIYGSITLQVEIYKNYGSKNEIKENITIQLKEQKETILIGEILVK